MSLSDPLAREAALIIIGFTVLAVALLSLLTGEWRR